jgi:hypothetical protein
MKHETGTMRFLPRASICLLVSALVTAACIGTPEEFQNTGVMIFLHQTPASITDVRIAVCSDTAYGDNLMGDLIEVPPGREFRVRASPGCYDARLDFAGVLVTRTGINLREDQEITIPITSLQ